MVIENLEECLANILPEKRSKPSITRCKTGITLFTIEAPATGVQPQDLKLNAWNVLDVAANSENDPDMIFGVLHLVFDFGERYGLRIKPVHN